MRDQSRRNYTATIFCCQLYSAESTMCQMSGCHGSTWCKSNSVWGINGHVCIWNSWYWRTQCMGDVWALRLSRMGWFFHLPDKGKTARFMLFLEDVVLWKIDVLILLWFDKGISLSFIGDVIILFISAPNYIIYSQIQSLKKLIISTNNKSNVSNYKFTNLIKICILYKYNLLFPPKKLAQHIGNI